MQPCPPFYKQPSAHRETSLMLASRRTSDPIIKVLRENPKTSGSMWKLMHYPRQVSRTNINAREWDLCFFLNRLIDGNTHIAIAEWSSMNNLGAIMTLHNSGIGHNMVNRT
ncbi:uncharacterized protein LOC112194849 isoform X2 [Rosa chinensis]|uniref:uncharacterized protein LOC112194849 isoform X2 n=1 Tax=Rosa chinensis TaxID=74649 RepID=UPI001AD8A7F2|nr:uncharacterized protein LOC112194849 isoform X2 [Rosa chinensis]